MFLTRDGAMDLGAILQLNGNSLMAEFHQKPVGNRWTMSECENVDIWAHYCTFLT